MRRVKFRGTNESPNESGLQVLSGKIEFPMGEHESRTKKVILGSGCGELTHPGTLSTYPVTRECTLMRRDPKVRARKRGTRRFGREEDVGRALCVRIRRVQFNGFVGPISS